MNLIEELDRLSLTLTSLDEQQASSIVGYVNQVIDDQLHPHIIDVLWKQDGMNQVVILNPKLGMCLERSGRGQAAPYSIPQKIPEDAREIGLWAWAYRTGKPVWLENVSATASALRTNPAHRILDEATQEVIDSRYFNVFPKTESIMIVPLIVQHGIHGIYSMELPFSGLLSRHTLELLAQLAKPLARIIYRVEVTKLNFYHTSRAIELFRYSMRQTQPLLPLNEFRSAFIARPFRPKMKKLEDCISKYLLEKGIKAEHYRPMHGRTQILEDIVRTIRSSHFVIADITGNNPNVLLELGVAIDHQKEILIFKNKDDRADLPVDLNSYRFYKYEAADGRILILDPAGGEPASCETVLEEFVEKLLHHDMRFRIAKLWSPRNVEVPAGVPMATVERAYTPSGG